jgi:hypothetical protein
VVRLLSPNTFGGLSGGVSNIKGCCNVCVDILPVGNAGVDITTSRHVIIIKEAFAARRAKRTFFVFFVPIQGDQMSL